MPVRGRGLRRGDGEAAAEPLARVGRPCEGEILTMIARGMTNPDIATELVLSAHNIKSHVNRIFAQTGSADRGTAIHYARDHDLG